VAEEKGKQIPAFPRMKSTDSSVGDSSSGAPSAGMKDMNAPMPVVDIPSASPTDKFVNTPMPVVETPPGSPSAKTEVVNAAPPEDENTLDALSRLLGDMPATLPPENSEKSAPPRGK